MVYLRIDKQSSQAKALVDLLKTMSFVEILDEKEPNETTKKAMKEAESGNVEKFSSANTLINSLNEE
jgi:hypothetical protein